MRSSISLIPAPGISTKTSANGTTICGSSSRGVARTAKRPSRSEPSDHELGQLGIDEGLRQPARQAGRAAHDPVATLAPSLRRGAPSTTMRSPASRPERISTRSPYRAPAVTRRRRAIPRASTTYALVSWPRSTRAVSGTSRAWRSAAGKRARPNRPGAQPGIGREVELDRHRAAGRIGGGDDLGHAADQRAPERVDHHRDGLAHPHAADRGLPDHGLEAVRARVVEHEQGLARHREVARLRPAIHHHPGGRRGDARLAEGDLGRLQLRARPRRCDTASASRERGASAIRAWACSTAAAVLLRFISTAS